MIQQPVKQFHYFGLKPSKPLQRILEKKIDRWIASQSAAPTPNPIQAYQVTLERMSPDAYVECELNIDFGNTIWKTSQTANSVQKAVFQAIDHLKHGGIAATPP